MIGGEESNWSPNHSQTQSPPPGTELGFEPRGRGGGEFQVTWFIKKKKIMIGKTIAFITINI